MNRFLFSLIIAIVFLTSPLTLKAQSGPSKAWDKSFGGSSGTEYLLSMKQTIDGGYIIGGYSNSPISGNKSQASKGATDFWIIRLDANGNKRWEKVIGGSDVDNFSCLQPTLDGGFILGGSSASGIGGDKSHNSLGALDYWIVKLDSLGNKQWDNTFGGNNNDYLFAIECTLDGGYILGGESDSGVSGNKTQASKGGIDYWVIRTDAAGNKIWDRSIGGTAADYIRSIVSTNDLGFILGGYSESGLGGNKSEASRGSTDYWVVKIDGLGNVKWDKTFGGFGIEQFACVIRSYGDFILAGRSSSGIGTDKSQTTQGLTDYWIIKIDATGSKQWDRTFGGSNLEDLKEIKQTLDGGYILAGNSLSPISGDKTEPLKGGTDMWLVKVDPLGNKLWQKSYGSLGHDPLASIVEDPNGDFVLGASTSAGIGADKSQPSFGGTDYWIVKLGFNVAGINELYSNTLTVYPNPSAGIIKVNLKDQNIDQVLIYNALGQVVLTKRVVKTDEKERLQLDLSKEARGVYTIQILTENQIISRKVVLQ